MAGTVDGLSPVGKPWRTVGTSMRPNVLLMCKLLFILLVLHSYHETLADPFIPFVPALDVFRASPGIFEAALKVAFFGGGVCLLFNCRVRAAALTVGGVVLLAILASKPGYRNHIFIVGCLIFLAGLHRREEEPWLLYLQMALIYFGAFLNKALDPDWRSGQFIDNWLHGDIQNPYYEFFAPLFPPRWFAVILSWSVIASEGLLMVLFLVRKWHALGVTLCIAMHISFFVVVGRTVFGHFTEDVLLAMLIFLHWPRGPVAVRMRGGGPGCIARRFFPLLNWDRQFTLQDGDGGGGAWFRLESGDGVWRNWPGVVRFLKYNAAFYCFIFAVFNGTAFVLSRYRNWF